jgi:hypothetical protein
MPVSMLSHVCDDDISELLSNTDARLVGGGLTIRVHMNVRSSVHFPNI